MIREHINKKLYKLFQNYDNPTEIADDVEESIYNYSVKFSPNPNFDNKLFVNRYKRNALKVIQNLTTNSNSTLIW